jgi:GntR family transcriptional regulator/MocR family aminotransferase
MARSPYVPSLSDHGPTFLALAHAIQRDIVEGRLEAGARLPGTRALADRLGVHRSTVVAAFAELRGQGWVRTTEGSGTFVAPAPVRAAGLGRAGAAPDRPGFDLPPRPEPLVPDVERPLPTGTLDLSSGVPDPRLLPAAELARAYRTVVRRHGAEMVRYVPPHGDPRLHAEIASDLRERRGLRIAPEHVLVTRGSQMALWLAARVLLRPGDELAVEALGYVPAWEAFRAAGARLCPVPVDEAGLDVARVGTPRALYVTPHHQFPSGVVLGAARRLRLLEHAAAHRIAVIEDDYDHEFHYEGRPLLPLASADRDGVVLYVGTLSKAFAPGIRIGYLVGPTEVVERAAALRRTIDRQGDPAVERAVALLLADGTIARHGRKLQRVLGRRRRLFLEALSQQLGPAMTVRPVPGGLALWARVHAPAVAFAEAAEAQGVRVAAGSLYAFPGTALGDHHVRLCFSFLDEAELVEAARRLGRAARSL